MSEAFISENPVLRALAQASIGETGEAFFRSLVRELSGTLGVAYAFVSERTRGGTHFRSRAFWARGALAEDFEVPASGTPCEDVLCGKPAFHRDGLQERFPEDRALVDWNAVSYGGVPLLDHAGAVVGHLAFIHDAPLRDEDQALAVMSIFARRAVAEIERIAYEQMLLESEDRLARILEAASDAILSFDAERYIEFVNRAAEGLLACGADELRGQRLEIVEPPPALQRRLDALHAGRIASLYVSEPDAMALRRPDGSALAVEGSISASRVGPRLRFTAVLRDVEERKRRERELAELRDDAAYLRQELAELRGPDEVVGRSRALRGVLDLVRLVAPTESSVLIQGETGTGKELVARAIQAQGRRAARPLVKVNCAALPAGLVESELFGHERGAFTGATQRRIGRFELAHGGTIFLDEIGELPLETQVKLLRVLQEGEFERVGGSETLRVDVRMIAATNRDLSAEVEQGRFRSDLFFRIAVFPIQVPPLRERPEDVSLLAHFFLRRYARAVGRSVESIEPESLERLLAYPWPGNVRELENVIQRALILSPGSVLVVPAALVDRQLGAAPIPERVQGGTADHPALEPGGIEPFEQRVRQHVLDALERCGWRIEGERGAARDLGLHPNTLRSKMKRLGIRRPGPAS